MAECATALAGKNQFQIKRPTLTRTCIYTLYIVQFPSHIIYVFTAGSTCICILVHVYSFGTDKDRLVAVKVLGYKKWLRHSNYELIAHLFIPQQQEVAPICSYDTGSSFLLLGCSNGSIYYIGNT